MNYTESPEFNQVTTKMETKEAKFGNMYIFFQNCQNNTTYNIFQYKKIKYIKVLGIYFNGNQFSVSKNFRTFCYQSKYDLFNPKFCFWYNKFATKYIKNLINQGYSVKQVKKCLNTAIINALKPNKRRKTKMFETIDNVEKNWAKYLLAFILGFFLKDNKMMQKVVRKFKGASMKFLEEK